MILLLQRLIASFFLGLFLALATASLWALWPEGQDFDAAPLLEAAEAYEVRILRDRFGVPHIYGSRDADVAFGLAYAHAEDDFDTIQRVLLATRGTLARVEGIDASPLDYMVRLMGFWRDVHEGWETDLAPETRALADAYAARREPLRGRASGRGAPGRDPDQRQGTSPPASRSGRRSSTGSSSRSSSCSRTSRSARWRSHRPKRRS